MDSAWIYLLCLVGFFLYLGFLERRKDKRHGWGQGLNMSDDELKANVDRILNEPYDEDDDFDPDVDDDFDAELGDDIEDKEWRLARRKVQNDGTQQGLSEEDIAILKKLADKAREKQAPPAAEEAPENYYS